jgi:circadian clock protein KaiC
VKEFVDAGLILLRQVNPAELTAGEFSHIVRAAVTRDQARVVVIDSVNGFMDSVPDEQFLTLHLRELLTYLNHQGVATFSILAQHGLVATADSSHMRLDVSYLADNVILMRYFEARGQIRQAISVFKKRSGRHERTVREFSLSNGITVGEPLAAFQGILTGVPTLLGDSGEPPGSS